MSRDENTFRGDIDTNDQSCFWISASSLISCKLNRIIVTNITAYVYSNVVFVKVNDWSAHSLDNYDLNKFECDVRKHSKQETHFANFYSLSKLHD